MMTDQPINIVDITKALQTSADTTGLTDADFRAVMGEPEEKRHKVPTADWIITNGDELYDFWGERNDVFEDDEAYYYLMSNQQVVDSGGDTAQDDTDNVGNATDVLTLNDPKVFADKTINMMASQEPLNNCPMYDPGVKDAAEKVMNLCQWWRDQANRRWMNRLHAPLSRDEHWYSCVRGWIVGRVTWNQDDEEYPWNYSLIDPANIYPRIGNNGIRYVIHIYEATASEILSEFDYDDDLTKRVEDALRGDAEEIDMKAEFKVYGYYDDHVHQLVINGKSIKEDEEAQLDYGFNPFIITPVAGAPVRATPWSKTNYTSRMGESLFVAIKDTWKKLEKVVSSIITEINKLPNPPVVIYTDANGVIQQKQISFDAGATNYMIVDREKMEVLHTSRDALELLNPLLNFLADRISKASLPPVLYGDNNTMLSGFAVSLLSAGARDVVFPRIRAAEHYRSMVFEKMLKLYIKFGDLLPEPVRMIVSDADGEYAGMRRMDQITPEEVKSVGTFIEVSYRSLAPQDKMAMAQLANMLVQGKIISLDTARGPEFIGLENPRMENSKVIGEMAYLNEDVIKAIIPYALQQTDPKLALAYAAAEAKKLQMALQAIQNQEADKRRALEGMRASGMPPGLHPEVSSPPEQGIPPPTPEGPPGLVG
jgi:hypothetical protein